MMNLFKRLILVILFVLPAAGYAAEKALTEDRDIKTIKIDTKEVEGKLKAGVVLGYPWGITAGYRFSNFFELNGLIGNDYDDLTLGVNGLFTIFNLKISNEVFPFSVGPALYSHFDHHDGNSKNNSDDHYNKIDLLGIARMEYSFDEIPLNLFIEIGLGLEVVKFVDSAGSFGIGVRYIF